MTDAWTMAVARLADCIRQRAGLRRRVPSADAPRWRVAQISRADAGIWRLIPHPGPECQLRDTEAGELADTVTDQARLLRSSLCAHRTQDVLYEAYTLAIQGAADGQSGRVMPPIRGLGADRCRRVNLALGRGGGIRVQPGREEELLHLRTEEWAVWDRARAYSDAVLALLLHTRERP